MANYLVHHGIQGQKWGVRNAEWYPIAEYKEHLRNRRETKAAKKAAKTQARVDKNEAYRVKLADKNRANAEMYRNQETAARRNIEDITKNGKDSEAYKKYAREQIKERGRQYESENSVTVDGQRYVKKYDDSLQKSIDEWNLLETPSKHDVAEALAEYMHNAETSKEFLDMYEARVARLDNMTIDANSKKIKTWMKSIWG